MYRYTSGRESVFSVSNAIRSKRIKNVRRCGETVGCAFEEIDHQGNQGRFEKIDDEIFFTYTQYFIMFK